MGLWKKKPAPNSFSFWSVPLLMCCICCQVLNSFLVLFSDNAHCVQWPLHRLQGTGERCRWLAQECYRPGETIGIFSISVEFPPCIYIINLTESVLNPPLRLSQGHCTYLHPFAIPDNPPAKPYICCFICIESFHLFDCLLSSIPHPIPMATLRPFGLSVLSVLAFS